VTVSVFRSDLGDDLTSGFVAWLIEGVWLRLTVFPSQVADDGATPCGSLVGWLWVLDKDDTDPEPVMEFCMFMVVLDG
jgi:hypothetical protein